MVLVTISGGYRCVAETLLGLSCVPVRRSSAVGTCHIPRSIFFKILEFLSWHPAGMGPVVATGEIHSCAVNSKGRLVCFGNNRYGQCLLPSGTDDVVAVGAGMEHTCVVTSQGRLICAGSNGDGQCRVPDGSHDFIAVAAGTYHTCAITTQRRLVCFGYNGDGQCAVPQGLNDVVAVAACTFHTCALTSVGRLVCFGSNGELQCSVPPTLNNVVAVAAGEYHTCAVTSQSGLVCFGSNRKGQCRVPETLTDVVGVAAGRGHTAAVTSQGRLVCFGESHYGQCRVPVGLGNVMAVAAGTCHTFAITAQGYLVCFGSNRHQQCEVPRNLAVLVAPAPRILQQFPDSNLAALIAPSPHVLQQNPVCKLAALAARKLLFTEPVIQEVPQAEPAAHIDPAEAAEIEGQMWVQRVERIVSGHVPTGSVASIGESGSAVSGNTSTLTLHDTPECLLADAFVWTPQGVVSVVGLQPGFELRSGRPGHAAIVQSASVFEARERNVVTLRLKLGSGATAESVTVTFSHTVMARKVGQDRYRPMLASEVRCQDFLRTPRYEFIVVGVEYDVIIAATVEIRLQDTKGSFFTSTHGIADPHRFIEVCGALAPLTTSSVQILHFRRFDRFREIICQNPELASCRDDLREGGFDTDLGTYGLGKGRLLVPARLAQRAISALFQHCASTGSVLTSSDIVVSQELNSIVRQQVAMLAPRINPVVHEYLLPLCPREPRVKSSHTRVELVSSSSSSGAVARSL